MLELMNSSLEGKRILLVEGETLVREAIALMLHALKMDVVQAEDGNQALTVYQEQPFDVVLADYRMATMRGDELAEAIKSIHPHQRVILITGYVEQAMASGLASQFVDEILRKPCSLEGLAQAVRGPAPTPACPLRK
jgi:CheY-like chemotaxis protein